MYGPAFATNTVLSGIFDGSEPTASNLPGDKCDAISEFKYQVISGIRVSTSGTYTISDIYNATGVDLIILKNFSHFFFITDIRLFKYVALRKFFLDID